MRRRRLSARVPTRVPHANGPGCHRKTLSPFAARTLPTLRFTAHLAEAWTSQRYGWSRSFPAAPGEVECAKECQREPRDKPWLFSLAPLPAVAKHVPEK